jgi:hypothetical protein
MEQPQGRRRTSSESVADECEEATSAGTSAVELFLGSDGSYDVMNNTRTHCDVFDKLRVARQGEVCATEYEPPFLNRV